MPLDVRLNLENGRTFRELFEVLSCFFRVANIDFDENGIRLHSMDSSDVSLVDVSLPSKGFDHFHCDDGPIFLGVSFCELSKILKHIGRNKGIRLMAKENAGTLTVVSENPQQDNIIEYATKGDLDSLTLGIPDIVYKNIFRMPSIEFQQIITDLSLCGENCTIKMSNLGADFIVSGDLGSCSILRRLEPSSGAYAMTQTDEEESAVGAVVKLHYLNLFSKAAVLSPSVIISLSPVVPIKFEYPMEEFGNVTYHLAPLVDEEGGDENVATMERPALGRQENVFEARLNHAKVMVQVIAALKELYPEANMICDAKHISIKTMDHSDVSLVDVSLSSSGFDHYSCENGPVTLGINMHSMSRFLKNVAADEDAITLVAQDNSVESFKLMIESPSLNRITTYAPKPIDIESYDIHIPSFSYKCHIKMSSIALQRIIQSLKDLNSSVCVISVTKEDILFCGFDNTGGVAHSELVRHTSSTNSEEEQTSIEVKEPMELSLGLRYLNSFTEATGLSKTVLISMSPDLPIEIEYPLGDFGRIKYYLAPVIGDPFQTAIAMEKERTKAHAVEEDTPASMTTAPQKIAAPKRKISEEKTMPAKKKRTTAKKNAAPSKKPRKKAVPPLRLCSDCDQSRPREEYFSKQWRKKNRSCISCVVDACRRRMVWYNMPGKWSCSEEDIESKRAEIRRLRSLGCERYESPTFFMEKKNNISENLQVSFQRQAPQIEQIAGMYDIVFYTVRREIESSSTEYEQRTTKGELTLSSRVIQDIGGLGLHGIVEVNAANTSLMVPKVTFEQALDKSCRDFEIPLKVVKYGDEDLRDKGGVFFTGTIRLLAKRTATGWNPKENPRQEPWKKESWEKRIVDFDSVEEAATLMKRLEDTFLENSWLVNHMLLPKELAMQIHEYVAFRPSPAFFFEKGDLWIEAMAWREADQAVMKTTLVARRRCLDF